MIHVELRSYFEGPTIGMAEMESLPVPPMVGDIITLPKVHGQFRVDCRWLDIRHGMTNLVLAVTEIKRKGISWDID